MQDLVPALLQQFKETLNDFVPQVGMILGSGLGGLAEQIEIIARVSYRECPGLFISTVPGHKGEFIFGFLEKTPVVCMNGRVHLYEGASREQLLAPIRLIKSLGCHSLIVTNAAASLRTDWQPGTLVILKDHINFTGVNILLGPNFEHYGPRFLSMEYAYDPTLRQLFFGVASALNLKLQEGVYFGIMGPQYETPAEIKMYAQLGGEVLGMSTVHEVVAARHVGLKVVGLTLVTNFGAGLSDAIVNHAEVLEMSKLAGGKLQKLIQGVFQQKIF